MNIRNMLSIPTRNSNPSFEYNYFSILKFIAAILIAVIHHNYFNPELLNSSLLFKFIYNNGHEMVYFFFIMSGVLFYKVYTPRIEKKELNYPTFLKRYFKRFFPLVLITTLTIFILNYSFYNRCGKDFFDCSRDPIKLIINLIFGGQAIFGQGYINNSPLWFFNILLFMYPIAFIITKLGKKYKFIYILLCGLGIAMLYSNYRYPFFNVDFGKGLFGFSLGILFASILNKTNKLNKKTQLTIRLLWLLPLIGFIVLVSLVDIYQIRGNTLIFTVLLHLPLIGVLYNLKSLNKLCSHKACLILEKLSIGIYFWNYPIMLMFYLGFNNQIPVEATKWWFMFVLLIVNIAFATLTMYINKYINIASEKIFKHQ